MAVNGLFAEEELVGDGLVGLAGGDEEEDLALARAEAVRLRCRVRTPRPAIPPPAPDPTITASYFLDCFLTCKSPIERVGFLRMKQQFTYLLF